MPNLKAAEAEDRAQRDQRHDRWFRNAMFGSALLVLLLLAGVAGSTLWGGSLAFSHFGLDFLTSTEWDAVNNKFGALVPIYGTLVTSFLALLIAVPVSFGIAIFLTELAPPWLRMPVAAAVELLAGIPSIIYGMWGLFVFGPFMAQHIAPWLNDYLGALPLIGGLFQGPPLGIGMLSAGIVLAIMIIPFITSVMNEVFNSVPTTLKESAYALGNTTWEVVWDIVLPYTRSAGRRHLPRPRPRPGRDHGGDLRAGQLAALLRLAADAQQLHRLGDRQRVQRGLHRPAPLLADRLGLPALRGHLHRSRRRSPDAAAPGPEGGQVTWPATKACIAPAR